MLTNKHKTIILFLTMIFWGILGYLLFLVLSHLPGHISIPLAMIFGFATHMAHCKITEWFGTKVGGMYR